MNILRLKTGLLVVAIVATAIGVVHERHQGRKQFVALQQLQTRRDELNVEWGRLQLEQATWAEAGRIEQIARDDLGLVSREPSQVMVIVQ